MRILEILIIIILPMCIGFYIGKQEATHIERRVIIAESETVYAACETVYINGAEVSSECTNKKR